jgi:hypothetical protein
MKKAIVCLIVVISFIACENESNIESTSHKMKFKFEQNSNNSKDRDNNIITLEGTVIDDNGTLSLLSDELEMSRAVNQETGEESYIIFVKIDPAQELASKGSPATHTVTPGYFYSGGDCWTYGSWITGDNGVSIFIAGSAVNQYLNNVCGWSNVA